MSSFQENFDWAQKLAPKIKATIAHCMIDAASFEQDTKEATDFVVLRSPARGMIAARVRKPDGDYATRYPWDFTIRSKLDSGTKTELEKIMEGFGDWLFYGHADKQDNIHLWWLIDLELLRQDLKNIGMKNLRGQKANGDGTFFVPFKVYKHERAVIAGSEPHYTKFREACGNPFLKAAQEAA